MLTILLGIHKEETIKTIIMKTLFINRIKVKSIWNLKLMLVVVIATLLSCSKEDNPEIETSLLTSDSRELVLGKWYIELAPSTIARECLAQYYLEFGNDELKSIGTLVLIDDLPVELTTAIIPAKICELPDETTLEYSWADNQELTVGEGSRTITLSIISVSKTHLIIENKVSDKMMVLKHRP